MIRSRGLAVPPRRISISAYRSRSSGTRPAPGKIANGVLQKVPERDDFVAGHEVDTRSELLHCGAQRECRSGPPDREWVSARQTADCASVASEVLARSGHGPRTSEPWFLSSRRWNNLLVALGLGQFVPRPADREPSQTWGERSPFVHRVTNL